MAHAERLLQKRLHARVVLGAGRVQEVYVGDSRQYP
jgi:hypothetical protein